jgi:hypothetical protein
MANKGILEQLAEGVFLGDGGYIIELERHHWNRRAMPMSDTEYNKQTVGKENAS